MQDSWNNQLEEKPVQITDYLRILYRGRWIIAISFLVVVAATIYFTFTTPPTYEAECSVIIDQTSGLERTLFDVTPFGKQLTMVNNQVEIVKSRLLAEKVTDHLLNSPVQDSLGLFKVEKIDKPVDYRELGIARIRGNLTVTPIRDTDIIRIKMKAPSAWEASYLTNQVAAVYRTLDQESSRGEISEVVQFLEKQLAIKESDLKVSEESLRQFQQATSIVALPEETQRMVEQLVQFETAYQEAETDLKTNQTRLEFLKSQLGQRQETLESDLAQISTPLIQELRQKIAETEANLVTFEVMGVSNNYTDMKQTRDKLDGLKKRLNEETKKMLLTNIAAENPLKPYQELLEKIVVIETEVEAYNAKANALKKIVDQYSQKLEVLPDKSLQLARLERTRRLNENIYLMMKEKFEESRITRAGQIGKIRMVDQAVPPSAPISPKKKMNLILGILVGLGLGVGVTFFLEYLDNSVRTIEDVERLKLPLLGSIPEIQPEENNRWMPQILTNHKRREKKTSDTRLAERLITHLRPKSPISEAYRSLRTQIQYSKSDSPVRSILVSSPGPGEGKSTSVTNIAIAMAQMGSKTILIDSDLRRPVLHNLFGVKRENGLTNYLVGNESLGEIIKVTEIENLHLITTGILPPNPSEILSSKRMQQLVQELGKSYDYILLDSPPLIAVTDALVLAPLVDGIILVLRSGKTDRDGAMRAHELLNNVQARLLGCLLNDVSSSYMYGSYYYYYYYYYYSSEDGKKKKRRSKHKRQTHHSDLMEV